MRRWRVPAAGGVVALLLVVGYYIALHKPRAEDIGAVVDETEQLRAQQAPVRREIAGLEKVAAREPEFRSALELLEHLMPSGLAQPELLAQLQRAADASQVQLVSVTFGDPEIPERAPGSTLPGTVLVALPVTVVANGQFAGITELLRRVEADVDRAVLVGTVAVTEGDAGFPELTGTWSGQAFAVLAADDPLLAGAKAPASSSDEPAPPTTKP